ncbi:hypothetical protein J7T55_004012 [Diaporthe amygdali]|uniref:uncharacterized protein n=1 Tax=Phomopsis amygdali TaxID=1214568 RepID=UPI0022FF0CE3|nr:uncharacterized protein J7T55_004012 [Diaporthe amygdali]KAJ0115843.1 hypothetical protein J7T55_004012 [Diaporthe amygdali]
MVLDPFTSLSLACSVVQFVDFTSKLLSQSKEIYDSAVGSTKDSEDLEEICTELRDLSQHIVTTSSSQASRFGALDNREQAIQKLAQECSATADELITALRSLSLNKYPRRRAASVYAALRTVWSRRKIEALEARMDKYRDQLAVNIIALTSDKNGTVLEALQNLKDQCHDMQLKQDTRLGDVEKVLADIRIKIMAVSKGAALQSGTEHNLPDPSYGLPKRLSEVASLANTISAEQEVLTSLHYKVMKTRYESIPEAYQQTFDWIFKASRSSSVGSKTTFRSWLKSKSGIFWITGKAGSGKSTLMKFLGSHERTSRALKSWAAPDACVIANFYFWSLGTELQKTQEGLLRSLLFEVLRQSPDLMPTVCPDRWRSSQISGARNSLITSWTLSELRETITRLSQANGLSKRFCFFIDGLDEYSGNHLEITKILRELSSSQNIKICVSSRPWNVFEDEFGRDDDRKIYIHDLTRGDITKYAQGKLQEHPNWRLMSVQSTRYDALVQNITDKAQGVFLWVFLVIRSLSEGLTNGDTLSILEARIRQFPTDLEQYFRHMLNSVESIYHHQMAETFLVALNASRPLSLMLYSFLDDFSGAPGRALTFPVQGMDNYDISLRHQQMRRRLNGRCKGLLEIYQDPGSVDYLGYRVEFLHRTVRDFLDTKEMANFLLENAPDIDTNESTLHGFIVLIKSLPQRESYLAEGGPLSSLLLEAFHYAYVSERKRGQPQTDLLDELEDALDTLSSTLKCRIPWYTGCYGTATEPRPICTSFLEFSIQSGLELYVRDRLTRALPMDSDVSEDSLLKCVLAPSPYPSAEEPDLTGLLAFLLSRRRTPAVPDVQWHAFIRRSVSAFCGQTRVAENPASARCRCRMIELLLKHGADPDVQCGDTDLWNDPIIQQVRANSWEPIWWPLLKWALRDTTASSEMLDVVALALCAFLRAAPKKKYALGAASHGRYGSVWTDLCSEVFDRRGTAAGGAKPAKLEFEAAVLRAYLVYGGADPGKVEGLREKIAEHFPQRRFSRPLLDAIDAAIEAKVTPRRAADERPPVPQGALAWLWARTGGLLLGSGT